MKKIIAILLLMVMAFALTGCKEKKLYEEAVALIESGDYAGAKTIFESIPDYEGVDGYLAKYVDIEITEENWQQYFELVETPIWEATAFDEGELFGIKFILELREEYVPYLLNADVAMEFEFVEETRVIEIDGPNFAYVVTDEFIEVNGIGRDTSVVQFTTSDEDPDLRRVDYCEVYYDDEDDYWYTYYMTAPNLLRVKGSISIFAE